MVFAYFLDFRAQRAVRTLMQFAVYVSAEFENPTRVTTAADVVN